MTQDSLIVEEAEMPLGQGFADADAPRFEATDAPASAPLQM